MNNTYRKPLILAENELAEGVYTASGSGTVNYSLKCDSTGNEWWPHAGYYITVTNNSSAATSDWSVTLNVTSANATGASSWESSKMNVTLSGNQIIITGVASLESGESLTVGFTVDYEGSSVTVVG